MGYFLLRGLASVALISVGILVAVYWMQRWLIYHPQPEPVELPSAQHYPGLRDIRLTTSDGVELHAWYWPVDSHGPAVLFLHGNGGDRSGRISLVQSLQERGYSVLALDYRGYGGSGGSPTEIGLYADAEAAAEWLVDAGHTQLVYLGESLGTGVAVELARRRPPAALILEAPFDSLVKTAQYHFPWLPVSLLLRDRFESATKVADMPVPLLVIHGDFDEVVPQPRGVALFEAAQKPKTWVPVAEAGHNDLRMKLGDAYFKYIEAFLDEHGVKSSKSTAQHEPAAPHGR